MPAACSVIRSHWPWWRAAGRASGKLCMCPCPAAIWRSKGLHRFSTIQPEHASMLEAATRSPPAAPAAEWLKATPPALRFILHADAGARRAAGPAWGVHFAEDSCRAVVEGTRATLWLGPDEYLLLRRAA